MTSHHRVIGLAYGSVAGAVTLYLCWPMLRGLDSLGVLAEHRRVLVVSTLTLQLVLPIATLLLVSRRVTPIAVARFRPPR
ncbi:MAG: hypothetical protein M3680_15690 [Myxococcota bacterium]|nr:hypothetical protein [Myxococcota bacterium]